MTTELYPHDRFGGVECYNVEEDAEKEKQWLIGDIIKPQLPNISDNVEKCLEMLNDDTTFKMAISSRNNLENELDKPSIRGMITRQGGFIVDFQALVRFPEFSKGKSVMYKMNSGRKLPLYQLHVINESLQNILNYLEELEMITDTKLFVETVEKALKLLTQTITLLQNPPKELAFPENNNNAMKEMFRNYEELCNSTHHEMSLELLLIKNEISIDFRNLLKVSKKPWCDVHPVTGRSFVDEVRDKLKADRSKKLTDVLTDLGVQVDEPSILHSLMQSTFSTERCTLNEAQGMLSRCVTFNKRVVIEMEKLTVTASDPYLISLSTKLSSLETCISNFYTNLNV